MLAWSDFSSESGVPDTPLLLSARSIQLALSAIRSIENRFRWGNPDDSDWNDIDHAIAALIYELTEVSMPDSSPVATVTAWLGEIADIPDKWLICDGDLYVGTDYPELYAAIADIFKDGFGNFRTPDMTDRFLFGSGINDDVGELGGSNQHTLTIAEMPSHTHSVTRATATGGSGVSIIGGANNVTAQTNQANAAVANGGGSAHNNMPAYIAVHWIIKALP